MIGVSKHLCGAATDLALRSLATFSTNPACKPSTILIALCCHHRCDWNIYVAKNYLLERHFKPEEFSLLCGLTSWATCGTGKPRNPDKNEKSSEVTDEKFVDRYDRLNLPRSKREDIGRKAKRILDMGRCHYIKETIGIANVKLAFYVDANFTLENVVLVAHANK